MRRVSWSSSWPKGSGCGERALAATETMTQPGSKVSKFNQTQNLENQVADETRHKEQIERILGGWTAEMNQNAK